MSNGAEHLKIAMLVADGFEEREMAELKRRLEEAGVRTSVVSLRPGLVNGWDYDHVGRAFPVDVTVADARAEYFDGLIITGGVLNQDAIRNSADAIEFVRGFFCAEKPVAAIAQGLRSVLGADVVRDRTLTSFPSVRMDLINAGANWVDAAVVVDHGLITSRSPADLEDFTAKMLAEFTRRCRREAGPSAVEDGPGHGRA